MIEEKKLEQKIDAEVLQKEEEILSICSKICLMITQILSKFFNK
jgi:hypothetical protein